MEYVKFSDIVEENGKTIRENNLEIKHNIPIGALVEFKVSEWHGKGACQVIHARHWVVSHDRDCDGTLLYSLSPTPKDKWEDIEIHIPWFDDWNKVKMKPELAQHFYYRVVNGMTEESLTIIEVTDKLKEGHGALTAEDN